jgi:spermidine synthase
VVEIDPAILRTAQRWFGFRVGPNTTVTIQDARVYVKRAQKAGRKYDLVMLDAFESDYIPEHMLTREFLTEVKAIMAPRGVLVANTWSTSGLYDHESVTYQAVFGDFFNMKLGNRIIVAQLGGLPSAEVLRKNAALWEPQFARRGAPSSFLLPVMAVKPVWDPKARILTDQYSPSNLLQAEGR